MACPPSRLTSSRFVSPANPPSGLGVKERLLRRENSSRIPNYGILAPPEHTAFHDSQCFGEYGCFQKSGILMTPTGAETLRNRNIYNLRDNLRRIVGTMQNVSSAAKELEINRQQLNKYLSGTSTPSLRTLAIFAQRFNVSVDDLFLSPPAFEQLYAPRNPGGWPEELSSPVEDLFKSASRVSSTLAMYCGSYFRISGMPNMPHKIVRAYTRIYQKNGLTYATTVEVFPTANGIISSGRHVRRLHALVHYHGERLYMMDPTRPQAFMLMICYPESIPGFEYIQGHAMSVSESGSRRIFSLPFVLQKIGSGRLRKSELAACGIFDIDGGAVSNEVLRRLTWTG